MNYDALIIIDMQTALVEDHPYNERLVIENIKKLIEVSRNNQVPIIYIRHDGGIGDELEYGSEGWKIYKEIEPKETDKIIDKQYNSMFYQTKLQDYLKSIHAKNLILCGMQSEYCFDVSCKVAFENEYKVIVPKDTTTTYDNEFFKAKDLVRYFEEKIWDGRYADVVSVEMIVQELEHTN